MFQDLEQIKHIEQMNKKLDIIIKLTALKALRGRSFEDRVRILHTLKFSIEDISIIVNQPQKEVKRELKQ